MNKIISHGFYGGPNSYGMMIILIKGKTNLNYFCTGCPKSAVREGKTRLLDRKKSHTGIRNERQEVLSLKIIWVPPPRSY